MKSQKTSTHRGETPSPDVPFRFKQITNLSFVDRLYHFLSLDSTNTFAKSITDISNDKLTVIIADRQTKGRGQKGNSFFSDHPSGLWCTIIQPIADITTHFTYNRAISLAITSSLASQSSGIQSKDIAIKWPNDVYWGNKKICGILLESHPSSARHIIIGFGLNVNLSINDFPQELQDSATSILIETKQRLEIHLILLSILENYWQWTKAKSQDAHAVYHKWLYRLGSNACINNQNGIFEKVLVDGQAVIVIDGKETLFSSGPLRFN
jgi:BirA family transcriptional regulator, biotin operon repressor / biotin---[acetyl-CoA-carboxylase] ligase